MDDCLAEAELSDPKQPMLEAGTIFQVAIEHRLMHAETLAYMLHHLPLRPEGPAQTTRHRRRGAPTGGTRTRSPRAPRRSASRRGDKSFGWDNEFEAHTVRVPAFSIDSSSVTNGEFLEFMRAGGYGEQRCWTDADWEWRRRSASSIPRSGARAGGEWLHRGMFAEMPLPLDRPVYVSHAEASAYARWRGMALPTEAQFHRAAYGTPEGKERPILGAMLRPDRATETSTSRAGSRSPAERIRKATAPSASPTSWATAGNGPRPCSVRFRGSRLIPFYAGYSANFFDGQHYVMKGGSSRTAACMLRRSFRNWFQPHYPYVYAKFRCVGG